VTTPTYSKIQTFVQRHHHGFDMGEMSAFDLQDRLAA
jgi:hypothetical protein